MEETKINVIIADDNKEFCNILSDYLLNQRDIMVTGIANDGVEALKLVEEKKPDLIILDIIMPHLDGLGVLEKLNSIDITPMPRVIVLSAVGQDKITQRAINLGADYYVVKPFDMDVFTKRIRQMFNNTISSEEVRRPVVMPETCSQEKISLSKNEPAGSFLDKDIFSCEHVSGITTGLLTSSLLMVLLNICLILLVKTSISKGLTT